MATSPIPVLPQAPKLGLATIANTDTTTYKTVLTAGANGSKVTGVLITSTDAAAARTISLQINRGGANVTIASANVAISAGTDGVTAGVDGLGSALNPGFPVDSDGQHYLLLQSGDILQAASGGTLTNGRNVYIAAIYSDF